MVKIALDPTPFHHDAQLLDFPDIAARCGYEHLQLSPHPDFSWFFKHPSADDDLARALKKRADDAGVSIPSILPVQRLSGPDEESRLAAVRNLTRVIELASIMEVPEINTEFSGEPSEYARSEDAFHRSMETLLPILEREGIRFNIDPHPNDFVEDGLEAWRVIRGLNTKQVGFVYVTAHTFHMGDRATTLVPALGDRLSTVYIADTYDHHRSHGLRYISNPPGNSARIHQHLKNGDGDVDFVELFGELKSSGFLDREDSLIVSNVFAEDERAEEVSRSQLENIRSLISGS